MKITFFIARLDCRLLKLKNRLRNTIGHTFIYVYPIQNEKVNYESLHAYSGGPPFLVCTVLMMES